MAKAAGIDGKDKEMSLDFQWNEDIHESVSSTSPIFQKEILLEESTGAKLKIKNRSDRTIYPRMILRGIPAAGEEKEVRNGLAMDYRFLTIEGDAIDSEQIPQGTDLVAEISLENTGTRTVYENVALTQVFPSGWEIIDPDFDLKDNSNSTFEYQDVRDDRVYTYLNIRRRAKKTFRVLLNATYLGKFYLPGARAEAMYDETINARVAGKWISVVEPGKGNI
jgi:uncharacterized protein YfaS (alpha-2-macroglobulin family)